MIAYIMHGCRIVVIELILSVITLASISIRSRSKILATGHVEAIEPCCLATFIVTLSTRHRPLHCHLITYIFVLSLLHSFIPGSGLRLACSTNPLHPIATRVLKTTFFRLPLPLPAMVSSHFRCL